MARTKKNTVNEMKCTFPSYSVNESLARSLASSFICQANPTVSELADIKCAVSEAVTNAAVHAYRGTVGDVTLHMKLYADREVYIMIRDGGCGIADVDRAMEPLYTTDPDGERSGMGFAIMQSFTDRVTVKSIVGRGTKVTMTKQLSPVVVSPNINGKKN